MNFTKLFSCGTPIGFVPTGIELTQADDRSGRILYHTCTAYKVIFAESRTLRLNSAERNVLPKVTIHVIELCLIFVAFLWKRPD